MGCFWALLTAGVRQEGIPPSPAAELRGIIPREMWHRVGWWSPALAGEKGCSGMGLPVHWGRTEGAEKLGLAESCLGFTDNLRERKIPLIHPPLL